MLASSFSFPLISSHYTHPATYQPSQTPVHPVPSLPGLPRSGTPPPSSVSPASSSPAPPSCTGTCSQRAISKIPLSLHPPLSPLPPHSSYFHVLPSSLSSLSPPTSLLPILILSLSLPPPLLLPLDYLLFSHIKCNLCKIKRYRFQVKVHNMSIRQPLTHTHTL